MKKVFISLLVIFISLNLSSSVTHIWPSSGVNDTVVSVHIFGDGFNSGISKGTYFYRLESVYQSKSGKFIIVE